MSFRSPTIRRAFMGFAVVLVILLAIPTVVTLAGFSEVTGVIADVRDTHEIVRAAGSIQQALVEMDTGLGAYLRGEGEQYLGRYKRAGENARTGFKQLRKLVSGNPTQETQVRDAENALLKWEENVANPAA